MKIFCKKCFSWQKLNAQKFTVLGNEVGSFIICPQCEVVIAELQCDEDEWEIDDAPEGYYDLKKIHDYYPNGG